MRRQRRVPVFAFLSLAALAVAPVGGAAQSGAPLMRRMMAAQAERLEGVDNVRITQSMGGMTTTIYMEKRERGGMPMLVPVSASMGGHVMETPDNQMDWMGAMTEEWAERFTVVGHERVDGHAVTVLEITNFDGIEIPNAAAASGMELDMRVMRAYADEDALVMRRMDMEGDMVGQSGEAAPVHISMLMEDYREVDGFLHPFRTRMQSQGMMQAAGVDSAEMDAKLAEARARLAELPEAARKMAEDMMKSSEAMAPRSDGSTEMVMTVTKIEVNAGPPGR